MATEDDGYKEGVDYKWVQGNGGKSNFKTRHFLTKEEKLAPSTSPMPKARPKAAAAKPKLSGIKTVPVTTRDLDTQAVRPAGKPSGMPAGKKLGMVDRIMQASGRAGNATGKALGGAGTRFNKYISDAINKASKPGNGGPMPNVDTMGNATGYKKGGMMKEGSAKDMREDKVKAKKAGMTMAKWESSAADKKHDSGMKRGGSVKSVGMAKRGSGVEKKAAGGTVRGAGCAMRGKTGAKEY